MRLKDLPTIIVEEITDDDVIVLDGSDGTRNINAKNFMGSTGGGVVFPFDLRKLIWRGKNLGSVITDEQRNVIKNGTFDDLYLGDYWHSNKCNFTIVDFDYWYDGNPISSSHHVVVIPTDLVNVDISPWTTNNNEAYISSDVRTEINNHFESDFVNLCFDPEDILMYKTNLSELKTFVLETNKLSEVSYKNVTTKYELMNEKMIFGNCVSGLTNSIDFHFLSSETDNYQMLAFKLKPKFIMGYMSSSWLRDISGSNSACVFYKNGSVSSESIGEYNGYMLIAFGVTGQGGK